MRSPNPPTTQRVQRVLEADERWSTDLVPHGLAGTNVVTLEISAAPPLDLERRLHYLITYPYGCLEQTTSSVFPQLYLSSLLKLEDARKREIQLTLTLTGPVPRWATRDKRDQLSYPDAKEFGAFATAIGRRYGGEVAMWSIWNEPNQPQFLKPQYRKRKPYSPKLYRQLYRAAYAGLRATPANAQDRALAYLDASGLTGTLHTCGQVTVVPGTRCAVMTTSTVTVTGSTLTVDQVTMTVEYDHEHQFVGPLMNLFGGGFGSIRLRATSTMRRE